MRSEAVLIINMITICSAVGGCQAEAAGANATQTQANVGDCDDSLTVESGGKGVVIRTHEKIIETKDCSIDSVVSFPFVSNECLENLPIALQTISTRHPGEAHFGNGQFRLSFHSQEFMHVGTWTFSWDQNDGSFLKRHTTTYGETPSHPCANVAAEHQTQKALDILAEIKTELGVLCNQ